MRVRWVHSVSRWGSLRSSGVVGFTRVRTAARSVHPGSLWFTSVRLGCLFGSSRVVRFTLVRVVGFIRGRWVHSGSPWGSLGSSWVVGFTRVRYLGRWVHPGLLDSLGITLGVFGFILGL